MLRKSITTLALVALALVSGCQKQPADSAGSQKPTAPPPPPPKPVVLFKAGFTGTSNIFQSTNGLLLSRIADLPSSVKLAGLTQDRLSAALNSHFSGRNEPSEAASRVLRALWRSPSFLDIRAVTNARPFWALGARLAEDQIRGWQTMLTAAFPTTNQASVSTDGIEHLTTATPQAGPIQWLKIKDWAILASGSSTNDNEALLDNLKLIQSGQEPGGLTPEAWLQIETGVTDLNERLKWLPEGRWPTVTLKVIPRNQRLRIEETWTSQEPMVGTLTPWSIPTQIIHDDPISSFTAIRGLQPLLKQFPLVSKLELGDSVDQVFLWSQEARPPLMEYVAVKSPGASNQLERISKALPKALENSIPNNAAGEIGWATNRSGLVWGYLKFVVPFLRPMEDPAGEFLVAGLWPILPTKNQLPQEMLGQFVNKTNLLLYHWESTGSRINQARSVAQLVGYVFTPYVSGTNTTPAETWLGDLSTLLDKTVTEATMIDEKTIQFVRSSQIGLGARNLVRLANWLDHTNFPATPPRFVYEPPVEMRRKTPGATTTTSTNSTNQATAKP